MTKKAQKLSLNEIPQKIYPWQLMVIFLTNQGIRVPVMNNFMFITHNSNFPPYQLINVNGEKYNIYRYSPKKYTPRQPKPINSKHLVLEHYL